MEKVKREIRAFSISQYPELEVSPVESVPSHKQYMKMKRKDKKLFSIQAVLFGRDLLSRQITAFEKIQSSFGEDGFRKIDDDKVERSSTLNGHASDDDDDPSDDFDDINLDEE